MSHSHSQVGSVSVSRVSQSSRRILHTQNFRTHTIWWQSTSIHSAHCSGPSRISHWSGSTPRMYSRVRDCGTPKLAELAKNAAAEYPSALSSRVAISAVARLAMFSITTKDLVSSGGSSSSSSSWVLIKSNQVKSRSGLALLLLYWGVGWTLGFHIFQWLRKCLATAPWP